MPLHQAQNAKVPIKMRRYLGDATMATTILDRLMHRAAMLEFEGKTYRLNEAAARITLQPSNDS